MAKKSKAVPEEGAAAKRAQVREKLRKADAPAEKEKAGAKAKEKPKEKFSQPIVMSGVEESHAEIPLEGKSARQIAYAWRVVLTQLKAEGVYHGEVPMAFTAVMGSEGELYLEPYAMPSGVVILPEEGVAMPAPLQGMVAPQVQRVSSGVPSPPAAGSGATGDGRPRARRRGPGPRVPSVNTDPINTSGMRTIRSSDGKAEVS